MIQWAENSKGKIQAALISLYEKNRQCSLEQVSVSDLCREAGIARSTFYSHYETVYDVMEDIHSMLLAEMERIDERGKREPMNREFLSGPLNTYETQRFMHENRQLFQLLIYNDKQFDYKLKKHIENHIVDMVESLASTRHNADILREYLTGGILRATYSWLKDPQDVSPDEMAEFIISANEALLGSEAQLTPYIKK